MYLVPIILARKGVGLGSESEVFDYEHSQICLPLNMRTNDTKYVELI
jgi:hypothetical protein